MSLHGVSVRKDKGMAKLYERNGKLYIDYMVNGERKRKSTKLDDTKENRVIVERTIIPKLMSMIATGEIFKKKPKTFSHYFEMYLKSVNRNRSYFQALPHRRKVEAHFGSRDIDTITRLDIKNYLLDLPILSRSKAIYLGAIVGTFNCAIDDGVIQTSPAHGIRLPREAKSDIQYFSKQEVKKLLDNAEGDLNPYLLIAFHTGMRPEEVLGLQWGDIGSTHISIKRAKTRNSIRPTKTPKGVREVPYPSFIMESVNKLKSNSLWVFNLQDTNSLYYRWNKLLERCEIPKRKLYATRHTFATTALNDGLLSINELAGILGHTSPNITLQYYSSAIKSSTVFFDGGFDLFSLKNDTVEKRTLRKSL